MAKEITGPILFLLLLTAGVWSFQWTSVIQNNSVKYVCSGHDLLLPWNFTAPADNVYTIQWYFRGLSEELVATLAHGHFSPSVAFSGRVEFVPGAGIVVKGVVPGDRGNYSVEVVLLSHGGGTESQNVLVEITEAPSSVSGGLSVQQDRAAVRDGVTGDWTIQLTCGRLTSRGQPPIAVSWITPDGHKETSTTYQDGNFHLVLPNPVRGGNYSCQLDTPSPAASCLAGGSGLLQQASVAVDEVGARLTLIEARQVDLLAENQRLTEKDSNLTSYVHLLENKDANLTGQIHSLQDQLSELAIQSGLESCGGINYTLLNEAWRDASIVNDGGHNLHCDQSTLPEGWYRFRLSGVNAIIPTTCVAKYYCGAQVSIWLDLQGHALPAVGQELQVRSCGSWTDGCCSYPDANHPVTVRNCGTFYIYKLQPPRSCNAAYCTTHM